jgi:thioredoxin-related protein
MKLLLFLLLAFSNTPATWLLNFHEAQAEAIRSHKLILVNFSGSDWCVPCIRLRKEILESSEFEQYAATHLLLVRADFPRQKKNQLSKDQVKLNESLADKYDPDGIFPYTLLVDEQGKVLRRWDGFPDETKDQFIKQIAAFVHGDN